jgi:hypothetical protein
MKEKPSIMRRLLERIARLLRRKTEPEPDDPYAYRTAPLRRPPHGRSGAAVVELSESEDDENRSFPPRVG